MRVVPSMMGCALTMASLASSTSILIPLYSYPEDASTWAPVYDAAIAHPNIQFRVIVNPSDGPQSTSDLDQAYIDGVAKLNTHPNVQTLGYVHTSYAGRATSEVENDVSTYKSWSSYSKSNITLAGIFFDEAPDGSDSSHVPYVKELSENAKSSNLPFVVFNPGTTIQGDSASGYLSAADLVVEFENSYQTWTSTTPASHFSGKPDYTKGAAILYSSPLTDDYEKVIQEATQMGLGAAYLTPGDDYKTLSGVKKCANSLAAST